jgi:hypothetical protein
MISRDNIRRSCVGDTPLTLKEQTEASICMMHEGYSFEYAIRKGISPSKRMAMKGFETVQPNSQGFEDKDEMIETRYLGLGI